MLTSIPTLDELAADPTRAATLPVDAALSMAVRCGAVLAALQVAAARPALPAPVVQPDDSLLTAADVARELKCSVSWWMHNYKHHVRPSRHIGRSPRWLRQEINHFKITHRASFRRKAA